MKKQTIELSIDVEGNVRTIYTDEALELYEALGSYTVKRASHVEPHISGKGWTVDLRPVGGPILPKTPRPYRHRSAALKAEETWIRKYHL